MSNHTHGPWRYEHGQHQDSFAVKSNMSDVWQVCETYGYPTTGMSEANARLIAAAPDLLAACEDAARTLGVAIRAGMDGFTSEQVDDIVKNHVTMKVLKSAIAKASGEA